MNPLYMCCSQINGKIEETNKANCTEFQTIRQCLYADIQSPSIHPDHVFLFQKSDISNGPN